MRSLGAWQDVEDRRMERGRMQGGAERGRIVVRVREWPGDAHVTRA